MLCKRSIAPVLTSKIRFSVLIGYASITARFESEVRMSNLDDAVVATWEAFDDECLESFPSGCIGSVAEIACDNEGEWEFGYML